ncbi:c-type cytochrome [Coraliomargarita akajimensis]|uniref:Cytochrome c class I n=1 Tax=Coraliomargarita akajimensis (strain DSM 45221 / IAM 15411 / JCM 23193 / KCTC 12865 / 04OKA010-24) TaxID=583355 RepID=D5EKH5_CORAD|nr:cytochrome c [Coraliomargarita akajimensis]ADE53056.1 cytochrome c class I [Coraliomargarita akajimensis DSM 45221]
MSDDTTQNGPETESEAQLEKAAMQDADVQDIHAQLMREKSEPEEGFSPVPIFLLFVFAILCFWGGAYFIRYSADFRWDVYDPDYDPVAASAPRPEIPLFDRGAKVFRGQCAQCHQANGEGVPGAFPPLVASKWVQGNEERLARILINGLNGPIEVKGSTYNGNMPAFGPNGLNLKAKDIAGVLTYIRQEWGNGGNEVTVEAMEGYLKDYGSRGTPWTAEELLADHPME